MLRSKSILFCTGAYVYHSCWDAWVAYFNDQGYEAIAPPWPGKNDDPNILRRRHPDARLAAVTMPQLVKHYEDIARNLSEKPIVIGHSFGGLIAQILMNKGLASACVAIHAVPPQGVLPYEIDFYRSNTKAFGYFTSLQKTYLISFKTWKFAFANGLEPAAQRSSYEDLAIPESKRILRGGLTNSARVDFKQPHPPLLIVAGSQDQCIPAHLCRRVYQRYTDRSSVISFVEKQRSHLVLGLRTWKENAEFIYQWLQEQKGIHINQGVYSKA